MKEGNNLFASYFSFSSSSSASWLIFLRETEEEKKSSNESDQGVFVDPPKLIYPSLAVSEPYRTLKESRRSRINYTSEGIRNNLCVCVYGSLLAYALPCLALPFCARRKVRYVVAHSQMHHK